MSTRLVEPGPATRLRVRRLMAEIRQYIRTHGSLPRIDSDDVGLQQAWVELGRHLEHNAKAERQAFRRLVARSA